MGKSKLAQHTYEEGQRMYWEEAKVLKIKPNNTCRKYKESVHVASVANPIAQPSLDICPIWIPIINKDVGKLQSISV